MDTGPTVRRRPVSLTNVAIDLRQMRYFIAVAEHLSFTRAAEEVFVAQQALSQQVKSLENNLGVELLRRDSRRVELTAAGKTYLTECKRILASVERAADHARASGSSQLRSSAASFNSHASPYGRSNEARPASCR